MANNPDLLKRDINFSGRMPLSELYKFWQLGILIREQRNVFFEALELKVGEVLVLPEKEMEIDGVKTGIGVYEMVLRDAGTNKERFVPTYCERDKIYTRQNNKITFKVPGTYYVKMISGTMVILPGNIKSSAEYVEAKTGLITVTANNQ